MLQLMERRLRQGRQAGERGVLLDGFPRTVQQAEALLQFSDVQLAVNLSVDLRVRAALPLLCHLEACARLASLLANTQPWATASLTAVSFAPRCAKSAAVQVLVDKCLGRRLCTHCKKNYNVADIHIPAQADRPEIRMPPLQPPPECQPHLIQRTDDNVDTVLHRVKVSLPFDPPDAGCR